LRPWTQRTAHSLGLSGKVFHTTEGMRIELEGDEEDIEAWKTQLREKPPSGTQIETQTCKSAKCIGGSVFEIAESQLRALGGRTRTPVDIAACPDCVNEIFDPTQRRYRHAFTHCPACGPRHSILRDQPFDRDHTSFAAFEPCDTCAREFESSNNRHFWDQTISCPECGPKYLGRLSNGVSVENDPIELAAEALTSGAIIGVKGYGSFQLAVDATNHDAVMELRERRELPAKAFPVMVPTLEVARRLGVMSPEDEALLTGPERAIVVVPQRDQGCREMGLSAGIAPRTDDIGLVLPCCPVHYLLLWGPNTHPARDPARFPALLLCSATLTNEPTIHLNGDAHAKLSDIADLLLEHDRDIAHPSDDPIYRSTKLGPVPLRLSRSTTPAVLTLGHAFDGVPPILAMGSDDRCAPAVFADSEIHLSAHIGNLIAEESADALVQFATELCHRLRIFPEFVTHGLNPENLGTRIAQGLGTPTLPIQHHHAHAVSCLVDNEIKGETLALVLDGADWGDDHTLWGGELMRVSHADYLRLAHIEEIRLPGGMEAAKEPWRAAHTWINKCFPDGDAPRLPWHQRRNPGAVSSLERMLERNINSPQVSSFGRLLDAAASLLDAADRITYEGEAIHALDTLAGRDDGPLAEFAPNRGRDGSILNDAKDVIPVMDILRQLILEQAEGQPPSAIARRFQERLAARLAGAVIHAAEEQNLTQVVLTGACFESRHLLEALYAHLQAANLIPLIHRRIPPNDGGLAVGQATIAAARAIPDSLPN